MYHRRKVDANQPEIVSDVRKEGWDAQSIAAVGNGCPDLLVGAFGRNYIFEIKVVGGKMTLAEVDWHKKWIHWQKAVVYCFAYIKRIILEDIKNATV